MTREDGGLMLLIQVNQSKIATVTTCSSLLSGTLSVNWAEGSNV